MTADKYFEDLHGYKFPADIREKSIFTYEDMIHFAQLYHESKVKRVISDMNSVGHILQAGVENNNFQGEGRKK